MFLLDIAFLIGLIALGVGLSLYIWSVRTEGAGVGIAGVFGFIIVLLSIFIIFRVTFYGVTYWQQGYFQVPREEGTQNESMPCCKMMHDMMMHDKKAGNMKMNKPVSKAGAKMKMHDQSTMNHSTEQ